MALDIYPPIYAECRLIYGDEALRKSPSTTAQPAAQFQPVHFIPGPVLERLCHLVWEQPALLHGSGGEMLNKSILCECFTCCADTSRSGANVLIRALKAAANMTGHDVI